jgi:hypothetical protein
MRHTMNTGTHAWAGCIHALPNQACRIIGTSKNIASHAELFSGIVLHLTYILQSSTATIQECSKNWRSAMVTTSVILADGLPDSVIQHLTTALISAASKAALHTGSTRALENRICICQGIRSSGDKTLQLQV